jgi:hypothetical protein
MKLSGVMRGQVRVPQGGSHVYTDGKDVIERRRPMI